MSCTHGLEMKPGGRRSRYRLQYHQLPVKCRETTAFMNVWNESETVQALWFHSRRKEHSLFICCYLHWSISTVKIKHFLSKNLRHYYTNWSYLHDNLVPYMRKVQMTSTLSMTPILKRKQIQKKKKRKHWGWYSIFSIISRSFFFTVSIIQ